jgi:hypothetical protein
LRDLIELDGEPLPLLLIHKVLHLLGADVGQLPWVEVGVITQADNPIDMVEEIHQPKLHGITQLVCDGIGQHYHMLSSGFKIEWKGLIMAFLP